MLKHFLITISLLSFASCGDKKKDAEIEYLKKKRDVAYFLVGGSEKEIVSADFFENESLSKETAQAKCVFTGKNLGLGDEAKTADANKAVLEFVQNKTKEYKAKNPNVHVLNSISIHYSKNPELKLAEDGRYSCQGGQIVFDWYILVSKKGSKP